VFVGSGGCIGRSASRVGNIYSYGGGRDQRWRTARLTRDTVACARCWYAHFPTFTLAAHAYSTYIDVPPQGALRGLTRALVGIWLTRYSQLPSARRITRVTLLRIAKLQPAAAVAGVCDALLNTTLIGGQAVCANKLLCALIIAAGSLDERVLTSLVRLEGGGYLFAICFAK
jgi:hypothetical protein